MSDVELVIMAIWFAGMLVLGGRWGNDMRLALNNLAPGTGFSDYAYTNAFGVSFFLACAIKPEKLTELGRIHREKAVRTERIIIVWTISGFLLFVGVAYYLHPR
jgi:hypothetical protein